MTPRKPKPGLELTDGERLARIEQQNEGILDAVKTLTTQFTRAEEQRVANWIEYRTAHERVVAQCEIQEKRITGIEGELVDYIQASDAAMDAAAREVKAGFNTVAKEVEAEITKIVEKTDIKFGAFNGMIKKLDDKISPLLFAHKILAWVAIGLGSAVAGLLWGILTHAITISFVH